MVARATVVGILLRLKTKFQLRDSCQERIPAEDVRIGYVVGPADVDGQREGGDGEGQQAHHENYHRRLAEKYRTQHRRVLLNHFDRSPTRKHRNQKSVSFYVVADLEKVEQRRRRENVSLLSTNRLLQKYS